MSKRKGLLTYMVGCMRPKKVSRGGKSSITRELLDELEAREARKREEFKKRYEEERRKSA